MIEPNRLAHCLLRTRYHEVSTFPECARCRRIKRRIPDSPFVIQSATLLAWGNRPFCDNCHAQYMRKHQLDNRKEPFLKRGEGVIKHTIIKGDPTSRPVPFTPVTVLYELRVNNHLVDSSAMRANRATSFIAGCSGPCLHVQLLSCHRLDEGSIFDRPDVYCVVWWKNRKIYTTAERENTSDPVWDNETAVVPLHDEYYPIERAALRGAVVPIPHDRALLRIQVYDSNLFTRDEFLGESAITLTQLLQILAAPSCDPRVFPLRPKSASGRLLVAAARTVSVDSAAHMYVVLLKVSAARDLASVDGSRPVRRPYVSCRVIGGEHLGESEKAVQADPDFRRHNVFCLPLHINAAHPSRPMLLTEVTEKLKDMVLHFEVRDAHRFGSAVLGELKLGDAELIELLRASDETTRIAKAKGQLKKNLDRTLLTKSSARMMPKLAAVVFADAHDFALQLSDEHNGRKRVKGTLGMRFIYHTRGTVLRGIDVGVRQMCLGERAKLTLRPDYGFDAARPGPDIPAHAELEAIVDLVQVGTRSATRIFLVRAVQHRLALIRHFCERHWTHIATKYWVVACFVRTIVCCMGILLRYLGKCLMLPISLCSGVKRSSLKLARALSSRRSMFTLNTDDDDDSDDGAMPVGDADKEDDDNDDNAALMDEDLLHTQFDLLDFEDAFSDEELEAARQSKLQNAKRLFDGTSVDPRQITTGLDQAAAAAMLQARLPPTEVDGDSRHDRH